MRPCFNIAGPCIPGEHYMLPPERRLGRVMRLIEDQRYFTVHAGRQTGKTTSAMWLVEHYNAEDRFRAIWVDVQTAREEQDPAKALPAVLSAFDSALSLWLPALPRPSQAEIAEWLQMPTRAVLNYLRALAAASPLPLVVFIDEADGLVGPAMVSLLNQLREGYITRSKAPFPSTVALIGQRRVSAPFTSEAATLGAFTEAEVGELLGQHTAATGQLFQPEAVARVYALGCGHPWLTNALADQIVTWDIEDRAVPITAAHVEAAKETLICERRPPIDGLIARLREDRVRRVLDPMLAGRRPTDESLDDDLNYALGLGLIALRNGGVAIANPLYRELISRADLIAAGHTTSAIGTTTVTRQRA